MRAGGSFIGKYHLDALSGMQGKMTTLGMVDMK
jgi:hypothetical protein